MKYLVNRPWRQSGLRRHCVVAHKFYEGSLVQVRIQLGVTILIAKNQKNTPDDYTLHMKPTQHNLHNLLNKPTLPHLSCYPAMVRSRSKYLFLLKPFLALPPHQFSKPGVANLYHKRAKILNKKYWRAKTLGLRIGP